MIVSIHQPAYIPWLGIFDRIIRSDLHVVLDHVTMGKDGRANRNYIRTIAGPKLLTVPIRDRGGATPILEIEIADQKWQGKHDDAICRNYRRAPFFEERIAVFQTAIWSNHHWLCDLIDETRQHFFDFWRIKTPIVKSTSLAARGSKSLLNLNICKELGATVYLSGPHGRGYLDIPSFEGAGIEVRFQDYQHPVYPQGYTDFLPNMSALDALFHCREFPL